MITARSGRLFFSSGSSCMPSASGRPMSSRIRATFLVLRCWRNSPAEPAVTEGKPRCSRNSRSRPTMSGKSSTITSTSSPSSSSLSAMVAVGGGGKLCSDMDDLGSGFVERQGKEPLPDFSTVEKNMCQAAGAIIPGLPPAADRGMDPLSSTGSIFHEKSTK